MSWQDRFVQTDTEKELYDLLEPIFRERTSKGDESVFCAFNDLRDEADQKKIINLIKNGLTDPNRINLEIIDMFPDDEE